MSLWTNYKNPTAGVAGGFVDLTNHVIDTRTSEEKTALLPGMGVVQGTPKGKKVKLPASGAQLSTFEGVVINDVNREMDKNGDIHLEENSSVGVMRSGRVYVRLAPSATPAYGDPVYLVINGAGLGCFTQADGSANTLKINARYIGEKSGSVAPIELYSQE